MNYRNSLLAGLALLLALPAFSSVPDRSPRVSSGPEVMGADFGLFHPSGSGKPAFVSTRTVPLVPKQEYGWIMVLDTDKPTIRWREEFTLPEKPETWGIPEKLEPQWVSHDGRVFVTEREVAPKDGLIFNTWAVAPGDPEGRYVIRVFVEGVLAREFEFEVK